MSRAITYATDSRRLAATPCAVLCLTGVVGGRVLGHDQSARPEHRHLDLSSPLSSCMRCARICRCRCSFQRVIPRWTQTVAGFAALSRLVSTVSVHGGSSLDGREQIFVEFLDGTPGRLFDLDDKVEVHMTPYVYLDYPERRRWSCRR